MNVLFTCHAQSQYDAYLEDELPQSTDELGWVDSPLTTKGKECIQSHRNIFLEKKIDFVLISPCTRCLETAILTYCNDLGDSKPPRMYAMGLLMDEEDTPENHHVTTSVIAAYKEKFPQVDFVTLLFKKFPPENDLRKKGKERADLFETFLCDNAALFKGKTLHVISIPKMLQYWTNKTVENYQTFSMNYDPNGEEKNAKDRKWSPSWRALKPLYSLES